MLFLAIFCQKYGIFAQNGQKGPKKWSFWQIELSQ